LFLSLQFIKESLDAFEKKQATPLPVKIVFGSFYIAAAAPETPTRKYYNAQSANCQPFFFFFFFLHQFIQKSLDALKKQATL